MNNCYIPDGVVVVPKRIDLIKLENPGSRGAEIGVWRGYFSVEMLELPLGKLYLVDAWKKSDKYIDPLSDDDHERNLLETKHNIRGHMPGGRVEILRGDSLQIASDWCRQRLDWVYIDADHSYEACLKDLIAWSGVVTDRGSIMGHDYTNNDNAKEWNFGVIEAVTDFCKDYGWRMTHLSDEDYASYRLIRK